MPAGKQPGVHGNVGFSRAKLPLCATLDDFAHEHITMSA